MAAHKIAHWNVLEWSQANSRKAFRDAASMPWYFRGNFILKALSCLICISWLALVGWLRWAEEAIKEIT
jgi:hypothetical protein